MNKRPDALTVALSGQLFFVLVAAAILALGASLYLLHRYRRAVIKSMQRRSQSDIGTPTGYLPPKEPHQPPQTRLVFTFADTRALDESSLRQNTLYGRICTRPWIAAGIYAVAGLSFAAATSAAFLLSSKLNFLPLRFLYLTWMNAWPVVLTTNLVAAATRRVRLILLFIYAGIGMVIGVLLLERSPDLTIPQLAYLWFNANLIPSILLSLFLNRRIRAVGPLLLIFMIVGTAGATLLVSLAGNNPKLLRAIGSFAYSVGLGPAGAVWGLHLLGFAIFAFAGWVILDSLRQMYERKCLSDQSVNVDTIWLTFGIVNSMGLVFQGARWMATGFVAFAIFKTIAAVGFSRLRKSLPKPGPRLLLLRVFALGRRSEGFYDALGKHWRSAGSIQMIAGPDLATSTVEPHEFLDFVTGKMARRFIDSSHTLDLRIDQMDLEPDLDARFRVTEFFCHDDTWKMTLARLADGSDVVLMDLRGFSQSNAGCIFEINELFNLVPLHRVAFVIDNTTDQQFLRTTMQNAWRQMKQRSPNRLNDGKLTLVQLTSASRRELQNLLYAIAAAADRNQ